MDLRAQRSEGDLETLLTPNFMEFKQVEMGIECSAKGYVGLIDILSCAQKAVLFPIAPLHDSLTKTLKPEFDRALLRIFRICDHDNDGFLNDDELIEFQSEVFQKDLQRNHITAFKEVLVLECEDFDEVQAQKGITFEAFKAFQKILIRKLKMEVCWSILRYYGYDDQLHLVRELWDDQTIPNETLEKARSFELKKSAVDFLVTLFKTYMNENSKKFDHKSLENVFAPIGTEDDGCPWNVPRETVYENVRPVASQN